MSSSIGGNEADLRAVTEAEAAEASGVENGNLLLAFTDALVAGDETALARARKEALTGLGAENLVDAAAVASNFERMVRIADATGIPLDAPLEAATMELRSDLGLARWAGE